MRDTPPVFPRRGPTPRGNPQMSTGRFTETSDRNSLRWIAVCAFLVLIKPAIVVLVWVLS